METKNFNPKLVSEQRKSVIFFCISGGKFNARLPVAGRKIHFTLSPRRFLEINIRFMRKNRLRRSAFNRVHRSGSGGKNFSENIFRNA